MSDLPIQFKEIVQLSSVGINPAAIGFATLTLESEKYICVRDFTGSDKFVSVVNLASPQTPMRMPSIADGAIVHPSEYFLALRSSQQVQIFDLVNKKPLGTCSTNEPIEFYKWISETKLGIVTKTAVYHWAFESGSNPVKMFARSQNLGEGTQIISYRVDKSEKWCCLVGISKQDERIVGSMQLYSVEKKISQPIEGHASAFTTYTIPGTQNPVTLFCFSTRNTQGAKLFIFEVGNDPKFQKKQVDVYFPAEVGGDFPVAMQVSEKYGVIYMITKFGYLHIFDLPTAKLIYMNRISDDTVFVTVPQDSNGGILGVNRRGQVLSITIDENNIVPFIVGKLNDQDLALQLASRCGLESAYDLFSSQFNAYLMQGRLRDAAVLAATSPKSFLRTTQTVQRFQQMPTLPGQPMPVLQYFSVLLEYGKLNRDESREFCLLVLQQGKKDIIQTWLKEDKLEASEEMGDRIKPYDIQLALSVYYLANAKEKVVQCLADCGQYDRIMVYAQQVGFNPDWVHILNGLIQTNPTGAVNFALKLFSTPETASSIDLNQVVDLFMHRNMVQETTSLLIDVLKRNKPEDGPLQTRLLEINLIQAPQVADVLLGNEWFSYYNRPQIASMCEKAGLYQRALEHYTELADYRRVIFQASRAINPEFLVNFFSKLSISDSLDILRDLFRQDSRGNLNTVVQVATKYSELLEPAKLIEIFEEFNSTEGLYLYLGSIINFSQDPDVHYKYIESAAKMGQLKDVERVCRESNHYDPEKVKNFLKEARLPDQLPLIVVCDRFDMVEDLTQYLYKNNMLQFIEAYVQKISPINTPSVVGALLDVDCNEDYIKNLVMSVRSMCPVDELVEHVEKRNRLRILQPWLEARVSEGNQEPATHNAFAKIVIDNNSDPEKFLTSNQFYDSRVVGKYCENRDPYLAFIVYKRGLCDDELISVTNRNSLFKLQARYLVERQSPELWEKVLQSSNDHRKAVIDQVMNTALPESKSTDEVSSTVKALIAADLPNELIELLEKLIFENRGDFAKNRHLQNLLLLTAIKADKDRVLSYVHRLDCYDATDMAGIAINAELFDVAFEIYKKFKHNNSAIKVLLDNCDEDNLDNFERAIEFSESVNEPEVYGILASTQLKFNKIEDAMESYIKANDPSNYINVIIAAEKESLWNSLVKYLHMCRNRVKEAHIESELIYALAKTDKLAELEEFITGPNCAQIQAIGDRCFNEELYKAARLLFNNINNFARLATTLVKLKEYSAAVEAARKGNSIKTWKEVNLHLIDAQEFRLAQICALHIIIHGDELDELIRQYEYRGFFEELISVLESGLGLDRAHVGMFTELAVLYSKYKPEKLEEHLKLFYGRINLQKVIRICEINQQWRELTWLYKADDEFGSAATIMIDHPVESWEHTQFRDILAKVTNVDIFYKAVRFYLRDHPLLVNDLLKVITSKIDSTKVVNIVKQTGESNLLPLIKPFLLSVQKDNIGAVNEALHELFIEEGDYYSLRESVDSYDKFDKIALAHKLAKHELVEFKRIAALLYKQNNQWAQSLELSKQDNLYTDAMKTAGESGDPDVVENLLRFFVDQHLNDCFAACLYTCYDFVRPDVVMELAWRNNLMEFAMPYLVQVIKEYTTQVDALVKDKEKSKGKEKDASDAAAGTLVSGFPQGGHVVIDPYTGLPVAGAFVPQGFTGQAPLSSGLSTGGVPMMSGYSTPPGSYLPPGSYPPSGGHSPASGFGL